MAQSIIVGLTLDAISPIKSRNGNVVMFGMFVQNVLHLYVKHWEVLK